MDRMLVRRVRRTIARQPLLQLYHASQYHPSLQRSSG
jgi:hypothetical protein